MKAIYAIIFMVLSLALFQCKVEQNTSPSLKASEILGNPDYQAMSFGGFRENTRDIVPTVDQLKEDLRILAAMKIKVLRTYNTQQYKHAANLLEAIHQLKLEDPEFEMYVMLGAWIDCKDAWTAKPDHSQEDPVNNKAEIDAAVKFANAYPDIVKVIAVGNEAMVHWASSYFVGPEVILKWVNYLQDLKKSGQLSKDLWITSSDNFASWGGGDSSYFKPALNELISAVDFLSVHVYPFHDTHYNNHIWLVPEEEMEWTDEQKIDAAMQRALKQAQKQFYDVAAYMDSIGVTKPMHIGETGWASISNGYYGPEGSRAADEFKQKKNYDMIREWTDEKGISCFYFEAFDEPWKDAKNVSGSENHFGLITIDSEVKYVLWSLVDAGTFEGLMRNGRTLEKSFSGDEDALMKTVFAPPSEKEVKNH
jgi:exo-beta-1,3-glucanase (GH17 family)